MRARFDATNSSVRPVAECPSVADAWAINLAWSSWCNPVLDCSTAHLAVSWSDGSACVYSVSLTRGSDSPVFEVQRIAELFSADGRQVSVLSFVPPSLDKQEPRLAATKGRKLVVWFGPTAQVSGHSAAVLDLSMPLTTVAGITWGLDTEELRLYTQSGSLFEIAVMPPTASTPPALALVDDSTADLWREFQQELLDEPAGADADAAAAAGENAEEDDELQPTTGGNGGLQPRIHGAAISASSMFDAVLYHMTSISDQYLSPKQETSLLLLRPTFSYSGEEFESAVQARFERHLRDSDLFLKMSSAYLLWDILQYCLVDLTLWPELEQSFAARFATSLEEFYLAKMEVQGAASSAGIPSTDARTKYREALFCNSSANALRLATALASALVSVAAATPVADTAAVAAAAPLRKWAIGVRKRNRAVLETHYLAHTLQAIDARLRNGEEDFAGAFFGVTLFETWTGAAYNILFAVFQPIAIGIFDQYIFSRNLERYPQLYKLGQTGEFYNHGIFWSWIFNSFMHSFMMYYMMRAIYGEGAMLGSDGWLANVWIFGETLYTVDLLTITMKAALTCSTWFGFTNLAVLGSVGAWFVLFPIYATIGPLLGLAKMELGQHMVSYMITSPAFCFKQQALPRSYHIVQEIQKYNIPDFRPRMEFFRKAVTKVRQFQRVKRNRGFAFSQSDSGQAALIRLYDTTRRKPRG
ncbi:hypothetical protein HDU86_007949 [Geranomyces michiganensis]|nr:hypothetical protein HDU86_007949 [Geranomyces michiganensis]